MPKKSKGKKKVKVKYIDTKPELKDFLKENGLDQLFDVLIINDAAGLGSAGELDHLGQFFGCDLGRHIVLASAGVQLGSGSSRRFEALSGAFRRSGVQARISPEGRYRGWD